MRRAFSPLVRSEVAANFGETAAPLMPWQERNRPPQRTGTQSLNTGPVKAPSRGFDRNSDIAESHSLDTKSRSHQNDAHRVSSPCVTNVPRL